MTNPDRTYREIYQEGEEMSKRCKDCQYYPDDCGYWDIKQRKKENATYATEKTEHNCPDFKTSKG